MRTVEPAQKYIVAGRVAETEAGKEAERKPDGTETDQRAEIGRKIIGIVRIEAGAQEDLKKKGEIAERKAEIIKVIAKQKELRVKIAEEVTKIGERQKIVRKGKKR